MEEAEDLTWNRETVPQIFLLVASTLPLSLPHLTSLLLLSPSIYRTLLSAPSLWLVLILILFYFHSSFYHLYIYIYIPLCLLVFIGPQLSWVQKCRQSPYSCSFSGYLLLFNFNIFYFSLLCKKFYFLCSLWLFFLQPRYRSVKLIDLEFARDIDDTHLILLKNKVPYFFIISH